jgi:hypothetical protein
VGAFALISDTTTNVGKAFLLIGESNLARHVLTLLERAGCSATLLLRPDDDLLREHLKSNHFDGIAVLTHDDVLALRYALSAAHYRPEIPLVVTIFDRTVAQRLREVLPQCVATSPAELAAPVLAAACLTDTLLAVGQEGESLSAVREQDSQIRRSVVDGIVSRSRWQSIAMYAGGLLRTHDAGTRMLLWGVLGVIGIIIADWVWLAFAKGHDAAEALLLSVRVVTTVGPAPDAQGGYAVASAVMMMVTVLLTAMVTAGFVDRLLSPRLVGLIGPRVLPRADHVIVVGLGQVGLRLCRELSALGIDVIAVERNPAAPNLRLVRALRIPAVVVGHGEDRRLLERLGARRARAVAVVSSDDLDNIAAAIAAQAAAPDTRIVIRAGEHSAITDTHTLLPLGTVRDVSLLSAVYVAAQLTGQHPRSVVADGRDVWIEDRTGCFIKTVSAGVIVAPVAS